MVSQQLLKVLGTEDVDLGEEQLTLDESSVGVVQDGPDGDKVLELPPGLLNNAVVTSQNNGHAGEVLDLGVAHNEGLNVEPASGNDTGQAGQDTGLVLDEAVEDVSLGRVGLR